MNRLGQPGSIKWLLAACTILLFWSIPSFANTQTSPPHEWVSQNAPEVYVVQAGDTLWDISCKFLNDPWRWQQVWCSNPDVEDPDLIYPGDKLFLTYDGAMPQIKLERGASWVTVDKRTGVVKLRPRVRSYPPENPIPTIAMNVIKPFLNKSRVVNDNQANHSPVIVSLDEGHIVVGTGDRIFVSGLSGRIPDNAFAVFRPGQCYIHPKTNEFLGIEGVVLGRAEREVYGEPSRLLLTQSFSEIRVGDRLIGTMEEEVSPYFILKAPNGPADGQIISVFEGIANIGQFQIVVITGGEDKGRELGDILVIKQTRNDVPTRYLFNSPYRYNYPPMKVGNCLVFRVFDKVSYALVMSTIRPLTLLDEVASP